MGGIIGGVAAIAGGLMGASASRNASNQQAQQYNQALGFQQQVYGNTMQNLQPFIGGGQQALSSLLGFYGLPGGNAGGATAAFNQFTGLPSYQFPLQQGQLAMQRQLASSGLIGSGAALRDSNSLAQGYASQGLGSFLSGLGGLANLGQNSAALTGAQGNAAAGTMLQGYTGLGNAQAAGTIGANNALAGGIGGALPYLFGTPGSGGMTPGIGGGTSSYGGAFGPNGGLGGFFSNLFNGGGYSGPSAGSLIGGQGSPAYLQGQLGLPSNQYMP